MKNICSSFHWGYSTKHKFGNDPCNRSATLRYLEWLDNWCQTECSLGMPGLQHPQLPQLLRNTVAPFAAKAGTVCTLTVNSSGKQYRSCKPKDATERWVMKSKMELRIISLKMEKEKIGSRNQGKYMCGGVVYVSNEFYDVVPSYIC